MEYSVQTFTYNGKKIKTVFCGGLPDTVATDALLRIAQGRVSVGALPYYAKIFLTALAETGISSLSGVTCADIRFFADTFLSDASAGVVKQYAAVINGIFDSFVELNGVVHPTLLSGDATYLASAKPYKSTHHHTIAGKVLMLCCKQEAKANDRAAPLYCKWYTDAEIDIIGQTLSLRDRCIFRLSVETGYRISSVLSIKLDIDALRRGYVQETRSKTGPIHAARISSELMDLLIRYIFGKRRQIAEKTGKDSDSLFLTTTGRPAEYGHFQKALKYAEEKIRQSHPEMHDITLHTHAGRSTFFNRLMCKNEEAKKNGLPYLSDAQIMALMDWVTMQCLDAYYDFLNKGINPSVLWKDYYDD